MEIAPADDQRASRSSTAEATPGLMALEPGVVIDHYRLDQVIHRGRALDDHTNIVTVAWGGVGDARALHPERLPGSGAPPVPARGR